MSTYMIPKGECLTCHYTMEAASPVGSQRTGIGNRAPQKGDLSICLKCGTLTQFDENSNMVALTLAELDELKKIQPEAYNTLRRVQREIQKEIERS